MSLGLRRAGEALRELAALRAAGWRVRADDSATVERFLRAWDGARLLAAALLAALFAVDPRTFDRFFVGAFFAVLTMKQ
ncbi:MAG: hypothetical protein QM778_25820 [Myxococcales bacterium]